MNATETVPKVVALTLALLTSLSQWFSDGMDAYTKKRYAEAAAAFTKVVEAETASNPLHDVSLYWRAQCRIQQNDMAAAGKDLELLLRRAPEGPLAARAAQDYRLAMGKPWAGLLLATPLDTWQSFVTAVKGRDLATLEKCCTGNLKSELLEFLQDEETFWPELTEEITNMKPTSVIFNAASNKALVVLSGIVRNEHEDERLVMTVTDGKWLLADEFKETMADEFSALNALTDEQEEKEATDTKRLDTLRLAIKTYLANHGRMPRRLSDLETLVKDYATVSLSAIDGRLFVLCTPPEGKLPWIFNALPYAGRRHGFINGEVKTLPENEFQAEAAKYGIRVPDIRDEQDLTPAERERLEKLVQQLGASSFKTRRTAYEALKAAGQAARELLDEATENPDPEIAVQARKLLAEL